VETEIVEICSGRGEVVVNGLTVEVVVKEEGA